MHAESNNNNSSYNDELIKRKRRRVRGIEKRTAAAVVAPAASESTDETNNETDENNPQDKNGDEREEGNDNDDDDDDDDKYNDSYYRPQVGDVPTVRYDCYTLSPIIPAAAGSRNNGRHEQQQQRKRTWIDGNFNHTKTGKMCIIEEGKKLLLLLEHENEIKTKKNGDQLLSQKLPFRHHHHHHHLQNDDDNRLLSLPLEFEIGKGDVIRGLEVGVQRMYVGDIIEITIPHLFAYSERGHDHNYLQSHSHPQNQISNSIRPKTDLVMIVKLIHINISQQNKKNYIPPLALPQQPLIKNNDDNDGNNNVDSSNSNDRGDNYDNNNDNPTRIGTRGNIITLFIHGFCEGLFLIFMVMVVLFILFVPIIILLFSHINEDDNDDSLQVFVNKLRGDIRSLLL